MDLATHLGAEQTTHYDTFVRTTLTIDDSLAEALKARARSGGRSFGLVANETVRIGLMTGEKPAERRERFRVASARRRFLPGADPLMLNQVLDEVETDACLERPYGGNRSRSSPASISTDSRPQQIIHAHCVAKILQYVPPRAATR